MRPYGPPATAWWASLRRSSGRCCLPEDVADIEVGGIHPRTLGAYARSFAEGMRSGRIVVREGAKPGLVSGSIVITEAEIEAARKGRTLVRQGTFTGAQEVKA